MRSRSFAALLVLLVLAAVPTSGGPAAASCAAPSLHIGDGQAEVQVVPGADVIVEGRAFSSGCDATGTSGFGCAGDEAEDESPPITGIVLSLRQDGHTWELGTADAGSPEDNEAGQVTWEVTLPDGLRAGPARLLASEPSYVEPLRLTVLKR